MAVETREGDMLQAGRLKAIALTLAAVALLSAGCVVEPVRPPGYMWVPAHYVYGPYGPYWVDAYWRAP